MFVTAEDYLRRAEKLEKLAEQTPNECLRKSFTSIATNWRKAAAALQHHRPAPPKEPLIDGRPAYFSGARR